MQHKTKKYNKIAIKISISNYYHSCKAYKVVANGAYSAHCQGAELSP